MTQRQHQPYLSVWTSSTKPGPVHIYTGGSVPLVPEQVQCVFSSSVFVSSFISSILSMLVHFLQRDAELGQRSHHLKHTEPRVSGAPGHLWGF